MDIIFLIAILFQTTAFCFLIWFIYKKDDDFNHRLDGLISTSFEKTSQTVTKFMDQTEKQQSRYLQVIERQHNKLEQALESVVESRRPVVEPTPHLLDNSEKIENTIEKEELEEQNLEDIGRIPIVDGMNVQFEGQEEVLPINIS